jgi:undecaprenyl-diphosphatase
MISIYLVILLAIVQALTEFLPISSSGHLAALQLMIKSFKEPPVVFDLFLHLGTLIATIIFFNQYITNAIKSVFQNYKSPQKIFWFDNESDNIVPGVIWGTIVTAVIAFPLKNIAEKAFEDFKYIIPAFFTTAIILFITKYSTKNADANLCFTNTLLIGLFQGIAIFPGISRSGATISIALILGINKKRAFIFSFLLSIPAIAGSLVIEYFSNRNLINGNFILYLLGALIAFAVGYLTLFLLSSIINRSKFYLFSYYCLLIGILLCLYYFLYFK